MKKFILPIAVTFTFILGSIEIYAEEQIVHFYDVVESALENSELTVDEAFDIAVEYNREIKKLEEDLPNILNDYSEASNDLRVNPENMDNEEDIKNNEGKEYTNSYVDTKIKIAGLKNTLDNYDMSIQKNKDILKYDIIKIFSDIVIAEKNIEIEEKSIQLADKQLGIAEIKYNKGILSEADFNEQNTQYIKKVNDIKNKKIDIDNLYTELNKVIGIDLQGRYSVSVDFEYNKIGNVNIDEKIENDIKNDIDMTEQKQNLEISEYEYSTYNEYTAYSSKLSKESDINSKKRNISETEINFNDSLNKLYRNIISKETTDEKYSEELLYKQKELEILNMKYSMGKATKIEIEEKGIEIDTLKTNILKNQYEHELLVMRFENVNLRQEE